MIKFNWVVSTVLATTTVVVSGLSTAAPSKFTPQAHHVGDRVIDLHKHDSTSQKDNSPPSESPGGSRPLMNAWSEIFNNPDNEPPIAGQGGSRGSVCTIAPLPHNSGVEVWSTQPLFVWQGELSRIEVRPQQSDHVLWSQQVSPTDSNVRYTGEALQPGQTYRWLMFDTNAGDSSHATWQTNFRVMAQAEHESLEAQLKVLEEELQQRNASAEEVAWEKAKYFAQNQLWSDVVQQMYSVENPSVALEQIVQDEIPTMFCAEDGALADKE